MKGEDDENLMSQDIADIMRNAAFEWGTKGAAAKESGHDDSSFVGQEEKPGSLIRGLRDRFQHATRSPDWLGRIGAPNPEGHLDAIASTRGQIVIMGESGSGKTTLAAIAMVEMGKRGHWIRHRELELLSKWSPLKDGFPVLLQKYFETKELCIDNLDVTVKGDMLETLLEERYDRMLRTFFTTADSAEEIYARWPKTGSRRIFHDAIVIQLRK